MTPRDADRLAARACYLAAAERCLEEGSELDAMLLASDGTEAISRVHHDRLRLAAGCPARIDPLVAGAAANASPPLRAAAPASERSAS